MGNKKRLAKPHVTGSSSFARVVNHPPSASSSLAKLVASPHSETPIVTSPLESAATSSRSGSSPLKYTTPVETTGMLPLSPDTQMTSSSSSPPALEISSAEETIPPPQPSDLKPPTPVLPWATKFKASLRNLKKMSPPTYLEDGTPVVVAPASVLLRSAEMWKGHIVAQFHGLAPPPSRIFADLNPIWGRFGNITVRIISETAALIFIPSLSTREWALQIGFWQAGNCSCTIYPWSSEGPLELEDLQSAPTWAILKNVPPQLYSLEGISIIASGIGDPLHTEKSRLDPINIGSTKVKVIIQLDASLPTTVVVRDVQGNTARVAVEYPRPPPKCLNCGRYGHLLSRCPKPLSKNSAFKKDIPAGTKVVTHPTVTLSPSIGSEGILDQAHNNIVSPRLSKPRKHRSRSHKRSRSTPPRIVTTPVPVQVMINDKPLSGSERIVEKGQSSGLASGWVRKVSTKAQSVPRRSEAVTESGITSPIDGPPPDPCPYPPGFGVMSSRARKKWRHKWNMNNKAIAALVPKASVSTRGEDPSGNSLL